MRRFLLRALWSVIFGFGVVETLSAQVTMDYLGSSGTTDIQVNGQSFSAADAEFSSGSTVQLVQMQVWPGSVSISEYIYLNIYSSFSNTVFSEFIGSSTNSVIWSRRNGLQTWSFDNLELSADTTYYAVFSTTDVSGDVTSAPISIYAGNGPYAGGDLISSFALVSGSDARFAATFVAVPEPSTWAAFVGLLTFGWAVWCRRR